MNRKQLLEIIESTLRPASAANGQVAPTSLSSAMRETQAAISLERASVEQPQFPLPTAECVACFVEGNASEQENQQVVCASVHDPGILLQVVNAVQALDDMPLQPSQELLSRLNALGKTQPAGTLHKGTLHKGTLEDGTLENGIRALVDAELVAVEPVANPASPPVQRQSTTRITALPVVAKVAAATSIAACLLLAIGWLWSRNSLDQPVDVVAQSDDSDLGSPENVEQTTTDPHQSASHQSTAGQSSSDVDGIPPVQVAPLIADNEASETEENDKISDALLQLEQKIAKQETVDADGGTTEPSELPVNDSAIASNDPAMRPNPASGSTTADRNEPAVTWEQITGILAQQEETGYDKWHVVSKVDLKRDSQSNTAALDARESDSWLTLPSCFARGKLTSGGQIVMGQDTSVSARTGTDQTTDFNLRFGSIVLLDVPEGRRLRFPGLDAQGAQFEIRAPASLQVRRVVGGIQVAVDSGEVIHAGKSISHHRLVTIRNDTKEFGPKVNSLPKWATELPKDAALPRHILASIAGSGELGGAIDKQLVSLARNLKTNNRKGMTNFRNLCIWRAKLSVEDSAGVTRHPLWFVRAAMFDMVVSTTDHLPSLSARRVLAAKLQRLKKVGGNSNALSASAIKPRTTQDAQKFRNWFEMAKGKRQPNRQDVAEWLNLLTNDDAVIASFADYLLRKRFSGGPNFNPAASARIRADAQKLWRSAATRG